MSSKLSSLKAQIDEEDVKSIFVGATKYEILNYLEDAKERGMDNLSTDLGTGKIFFKNFKIGGPLGVLWTDLVFPSVLFSFLLVFCRKKQKVIIEKPSVLV